MNCKICGSTDIQKLFTSQNVHGHHLLSNENFDVYECLQCRAAFINVKINKHYYNKYYKADYYKSNLNGLMNLFLTSLGNFSSHRKQQFILNKFPKNKNVRLLDIGCGSGEFLKSLDKNRFDKFGIEINPIAAELCRGKGLKVYNENIFDKDFGVEKYDVVTLWHVLEHLKNPIELFVKAHTILNKDGLLIFQVPNSGCLGFKIGKKYWFHLDSPRHLWIPDKTSIKFLCDMAGFDIIEIKNEFYDYPLDLFWSIRKSILKFIIYPLYPFLKFYSREHLTFICKKK